MRTRRRIPAALALGGVAIMLPGQVMAEGEQECEYNTAAFPVGSWNASGVTFIMPIADGFSTGYLEGELGFTVHVETDGTATGFFNEIDTAMVEDDHDAGSSNAVIVQNGEAVGTGARLEVTGVADYFISSFIDVSGADGKDFFTGGPLLFENQSDFSAPFSLEIVPSFANCGEVVGNLSHTDSPILFIATRTSDQPELDASIEERVVHYLESIQALSGSDLLDGAALADLIAEAEGLDALLAGQSYCATEELGSLAPGGSVRDLLRSALVGQLYAFADRATAGEYSVSLIINIYANAIRGALIGGQAGTCVDDDGDARAGLRAAFVQVLLARYEAAVQAGNTTEIGMIKVAAAQFGMTEVTQAIGG